MNVFEGVKPHYMGFNLFDVFNKADESLVAGDLTTFIPTPTGLDPLDTAIGGGVRKNDLILLGGAQGVGKTITALQVARNIAMLPDHYVYFVSFEHSEIHLMNRLFCLESITPPDIDLSNGVDLRYLNALIEKGSNNFRNQPGVLNQIYSQDSKLVKVMSRINTYGRRLIITKANQSATSLDVIRRNTEWWLRQTNGQLTLFIDYLQKIPLRDTGNHPVPEEERVTLIVETLKDIAMSFNIPVWSIVAASREGLRSKRMHLYHMRGGSALDYECDIAIIMHNKYAIAIKDKLAHLSRYEAEGIRNWVVFTIEKNRAGRGFQNIEFELHGKHFALDPRGRVSPPEYLIGGRGEDWGE